MFRKLHIVAAGLLFTCGMFACPARGSLPHVVSLDDTRKQGELTDARVNPGLSATAPTPMPSPRPRQRADEKHPADAKPPGSVDLGPSSASGGARGADPCNPDFVVPYVPYTTVGNTCAYTHHWDYACPYTGSTAPEVIYAYTPIADLLIDIDLCYSSYDTKVYVYQDVCGGTPIACNDDYYFGAPCYVYSSYLEAVPLAYGHTYYIVVDGYGSACGDYQLDIIDRVWCVIECEGTPEGEPECYDNYIDTTNSGCGGNPVVFSSIACDETVCGTSGTYLFGSSQYRDTDWYATTTSITSYFTWTARGAFPVQILAIAANSGNCSDYVILDYATAPTCETATIITNCQPAGLYWFWIGPSVFSGIPCGADYEATLSCVPCTPPPCADFLIPVGSLPFSDTGNTCLYTNDWDYACPFTGSTSPDVVYEYTPTSNVAITVDLCESGYDTKVYIYEDVCGGIPIACNDDYCSDSQGNPYRSYLGCVSLTAGHAYYIVVDGYGGDCGTYQLEITECVPCVIDCTGTPEGEPECYDGYVDTTNSGCSGNPPVYSPMACGETICGKAGTYLVGSLQYRDTDWYAITTTSGYDFTWSVTAEFDLLIFIIVANSGNCSDYTIYGYATAAPCATATLITTECMPPGLYWFWAGPSVFSGIPCDRDYEAILTCTPCGAVTGACCDDASGTCAENVAEVDCTGPQMRFLPGGTCADFDPPCGGCIPPGADCMSSAGGTWTFGTPSIPAIPADFFGPGSDSFEGTVALAAVPGDTGMIVQRTAPYCPDPEHPSDVIPIEIVQLHLQSAAPITVPGHGTWDVQILPGGTGGPGSASATLLSEHGGTFSWGFEFQPFYVFTHLEPPFEVLTYHPGSHGIPPIFLHTPAPADWSTDDSLDACDIDGFAAGVYTDPATLETCTTPTCLLSYDAVSVQLCLHAYTFPACPPPPHDNCTDALVISGTGMWPFDTHLATPDGIGDFMTGPDIWFHYAADGWGTLRISTCGSSYDTRIAVYDVDPCDGTIEPIAISDNYPNCGLGSRVHVPVVAGQSLFIQIGGTHDDAGPGWLSLTLNDDVCVREPAAPRTLIFDYNNDRALDMRDVAALQLCYTGPGVPASSPCEWAFDTDADREMDFDDAELAMSSLVGPWQPELSTEPVAAVCPLPGALTDDPVPGFAWNSCEQPDVLYRLHVYAVPPGMQPEEVIGVLPAHLLVDELAEPETSFPDGAAPLLPGTQYVWFAEAYSGADPSIVLCSGTPVALNVNAATPSERLRALLEHLEEIRRKLEQAHDDLENNPLVQEVRLIEAIGRILTNLGSIDQTAIDALEAFINCDEDALNDLNAETLDKVLQILQGILKLYMTANDDLTAAQKNILKNIVEKIQEVRDGLAQIAEIKQVLSPNWNVWEYLQGALVDRLEDAIKEAAEKALAKIVGAKAAGAILSILIDLYNFGDALYRIQTIEDLRRAWNLMMLKVIEAAAAVEGMLIQADWAWVNNYVWAICSEYDGARFKVTPVMRCWRPTEGGNPGEGKWEDCPVSFTNQGHTTYTDAEGKKSIEFGTGDMETEQIGEPPNTTTLCKYHVSIRLGECAGPCYVLLNVEITKADGTKEVKSFIVGVKQ